MIEHELWAPRAKHFIRSYQPRPRRASEGELVQIDGSDHEWFEGRAPRCTLLVYVDDATSKLKNLRFVESESTQSYFKATKAYVKEHGKPLALYSDKLGVFRSNHKVDKGTGDGITQFGRALESLNIEIICANSPQAKGRVERANGVLQDRLVKELRYKKINSMDEANAYLPEFIEQYNQKFGKEPLSGSNVHTPLRINEIRKLDQIFCWQETRVLAKDLTLIYERTKFIVEDSIENRKLRGKDIKVYDYKDGRIVLEYKERVLKYRTFEKIASSPQGRVVNSKRLDYVLRVVKDSQA